MEDVTDTIAKLTTGGNGRDAVEMLSGQELLARQRAVTGVLASHPTSLDCRVEKFSITVAGQGLLDDATLELNVGTRYGFIGQNGSGKTNVLNAIALREVPIPVRRVVKKMRWHFSELALFTRALLLRVETHPVDEMTGGVGPRDHSGDTPLE